MNYEEGWRDPVAAPVMSASEDAPARYNVTRIALIDALAAIPIGGFLTLEARAGWADAILAQLPAVTERRFDRDPEALAWARGHVERVAAKYEAFETRDRESGDEERALQWHKYVSLLHREFIGGTGCVITAFDERLPSLPVQDEVAW